MSRWTKKKKLKIKVKMYLRAVLVQMKKVNKSNKKQKMMMKR